MLEVTIGLRYLRARRKERFVSLIALISLAGIVIGTFALSVVLSVMSGFEHDLRRRLLAFNPHIVVQQAQGDDQELRKLANKIARIPSVIGVAPYVSSQVMVASVGLENVPGYMSGGLARGVTVGKNPTLGELQRTLVEGSLDSLGEPVTIVVGKKEKARKLSLNGVILGDGLAAELGLRLGDPVTLISPTSLVTGALVPRLKRYAVSGLFHSGLDEYDSALVFMSLDDARVLFKDDSQLERGLQVELRHLFTAPAVAREISKLAGPNFSVEDWTHTDQSLFTALKLEKSAYFVVLLLIVLVAAFNIIATLTMVVTERRREIAILRAMGLKRSSVLAIFLLQGGLLGVIGSLVGVGMGFIASFLIDRYHFLRLPAQSFIVSVVPVELEPLNFLLVAGAAIILSLFASLYPALQASSLIPAEVIRYG